MIIKKEFLDSMVRCPYTGQSVVLRFIDSRLYPKYAIAYPDYFELDIIEKKK